MAENRVGSRLVIRFRIRLGFRSFICFVLSASRSCLAGAVPSPLTRPSNPFVYLSDRRCGLGGRFFLWRGPERARRAQYPPSTLGRYCALRSIRMVSSLWSRPFASRRRPRDLNCLQWRRLTCTPTRVIRPVKAINGRVLLTSDGLFRIQATHDGVVRSIPPQAVSLAKPVAAVF